MLYSQFTLLEKQGSCSIVVYALLYFAHVGYLAVTIKNGYKQTGFNACTCYGLVRPVGLDVCYA